MALQLDMQHFSEWIGKTETHSDLITPVPVQALSATLDRNDPLPQEGDPLPPLWSWLYFLPICPQSEIGPDGHAKRGGFVPPIPLPRRMYAGGRMDFPGVLRVGDRVSRLSRIADVKLKEGRTGPLAFVKVHHEISNADGVALTEDHDIVYRDSPKPGETAPAPQAAPHDASWRREIKADEVFLFRYSALTFNGHRIHYDRRYVTEVEGYPGLIVHGPLIATLLADLFRRNLPDARLSSFSFRALRPLFDIAPFSVNGKLEANSKEAKLWAADADGWLAMEATATLA